MSAGTVALRITGDLDHAVKIEKLLAGLTDPESESVLRRIDDFRRATPNIDDPMLLRAVSAARDTVVEERGVAIDFRESPRSESHVARGVGEAPAPGGGPVAMITRMSEVERRSVEWLWRDRIPAGMLTLFEGDPGIGKSTLLYDLVARVTRGWAMPNELGCDTGEVVREPRTVLVLSAEDDPHAVIRPRLDAAGADVERVITIKMQTEEGTREPLITDQDVAAWLEVVRAENVALVIVDPIVAYLPDGTDTNSDHSVRRGLGRLKPLAEAGCAVIGVKHWRKGASDKAIYRGGGSIGFVGAARSVLVAGYDPDDETQEKRVFAVVKSNLAAIAPSLSYRVTVPPGHEVPHVEWLGISDHNADALTAAPTTGEERSALREARDFLQEVLVDGPIPEKEVSRRAKAGDISKATLRRAVKLERITKAKEGFAGGQWTWALPEGRRP